MSDIKKERLKNTHNKITNKNTVSIRLPNSGVFVTTLHLSII